MLIVTVPLCDRKYVTCSYMEIHPNALATELARMIKMCIRDRCRIEVVDGFDQTDASNLKEIIYVLVVPGKALDYT